MYSYVVYIYFLFMVEAVKNSISALKIRVIHNQLKFHAKIISDLVDILRAI